MGTQVPAPTPYGQPVRPSHTVTSGWPTLAWQLRVLRRQGRSTSALESRIRAVGEFFLLCSVEKQILHPDPKGGNRERLHLEQKNVKTVSNMLQLHFGTKIFSYLRGMDKLLIEQILEYRQICFCCL